MAETSEQHTAEDLVPIQNFMRRFSHVDNHQELNRLSMEAAAAAAAAAAKEPSRWEKFLNLFRRAEQPPVREPTRFDFILLPLLNVKNWLREATHSRPVKQFSICEVCRWSWRKFSWMRK